MTLLGIKAAIEFPD